MLLFIGSNKEKCNFNTFRKQLNFLLAIYNGEISLKEAEIFQRKIETKIEELKFDYRPKMEYWCKKMTCWNRVIKLLMHLKMVLFLLNILSDAAAHGYVLKDVNDFIQEIESMSENLYPNLFNEFFWIITSWLCKRAYQY